MRRILPVILLAGCSLTQPRVDKPEVPLPEPYKACAVKPQVIIHEGIPYVGYTYSESVEKAICEENLLRYIKDLNKVLCYYRECDDKGSK